MTREEAASLLSVAIDASAGEVRGRYQELYSDYQVRLTNAPTPGLKKAYQKNLEELRQACETLSPGFVFDSPADFPSAQPVRNITSSSLDAGTRQRRAALVAAPPTAAKADGLPKSTIVVGILAAILAATASLFAIKWMSLVALEDALRGTTDNQVAALVKMPGQADDLKKSLSLLKNGLFQVCNQSSEAIKITALAVTYRDREDHLKTFNSSFYNWVSWDLVRGARKPLYFERAGEMVWDGSVLFYAVNLTHKGNDYFIAGAWRDVKDGCLQITLQ
jgi:hypothetical protein